MTLKDLKEKLSTLSEEQLQQLFIYNSEDLSISGVAKDFKKASKDLYYTGDDDPASLYTKKELKEQGYSKEDIDTFTIEIVKGDFYLDF